MKLEDIKNGDTLIVRGTGYKSGMHWQHTVVRVTATQIHTKMDNTSVHKFNRFMGYELPRDKYVPNYIEICNGERVENAW